MGIKIEWTDHMDTVIRSMRNDGFSWPEIGKRFALSAETVKRHGMSLGLPGSLTYSKPSNIFGRAGSRHPLPAGHLISMGAIQLHKEIVT